MTCGVRKSKGNTTKGCNIDWIGETSQAEYQWCVDCGVLIRTDKERDKVSICIPNFDPQPGEKQT